VANHEHAFTNRLINEKSPYLLQHAHNPVDWYPWGQDAFEKARSEQKPIFLSIGYATCHWCHVMEEESFEDVEVAKALNEAFVCVKVDREELPEVDSLYMEFAQAMILGAAGWPLNLLLTPDLKPFFAATYLPKHSFRGMIGVMELTDKISDIWRGPDRERLVNQAEKIVTILGAQTHKKGEDLPDEMPIEDTAEILFKVADPVFGGMKGSPKFPLGYQTNFLLRFFQKSQDARALFLVDKTLEMMHRGGIYDHLGGGFHRYAVDEHWHIPHFEKMLYDNALLVYAYLDAWKVSKRLLYRQVACETCDYILRDLQHPEGGFYSAEDADSEGKEGFYYTWSRQEVMSQLGEDIGSLFCDLYGVFQHGMVEGKSVVRMGMSFEEFSAICGIDTPFLEEMMAKARSALFKERVRRSRPFLDDKIITACNGLAIFSLCETGFTLQRNDYMQAALLAAAFIKEHLYKEKVLYRRYRENDARFQANLDDYAYLIRALLSLFEADGGTSWLQWAIELADALEQKYKADTGAYYQAAPDDQHLLIRKCHFADGAEPSGNAVHAENLIRLWQITGDDRYLLSAEDIFKAVKHYVDAYPLGYCYHLMALQRYFDTQKATCIIALDDESRGLEEIKIAFSQKKSPHHALIWKHPNDTALDTLQHVQNLPNAHKKTTLYICREGVCSAPISDIDAIEKAIGEL